MWRAQEDVVVEQHPCEVPPVPALNHPREPGDTYVSVRAILHDGAAFRSWVSECRPSRPWVQPSRSALSLVARGSCGMLALTLGVPSPYQPPDDGAGRRVR